MGDAGRIASLIVGWSLQEPARGAGRPYVSGLPTAIRSNACVSGWRSRQGSRAISGVVIWSAGLPNMYFGTMRLPWRVDR